MDEMAEWQWKRWDAMARVGGGKLTMREAALVLGLSVRQVRRGRRDIERGGRRGAPHRKPGGAPADKLAAPGRPPVVTLRRGEDPPLHDQHLSRQPTHPRPPSAAYGG